MFDLCGQFLGKIFGYLDLKNEKGLSLEKCYIAVF